MQNAQLFATTYNLYNQGKQFATKSTGYWIGVEDIDLSQMHDEFISTERKVLQDETISDVEIMFTDCENMPRSLYAESLCQEGLNEIIAYNDLDDDQCEIVQYFLDNGYKIEEAISKAQNCYIFDGSRSDYAYEHVNETQDLSGLGWLENYIDYDAIGRDLELENQITELSYNRFLVDYS